MPQMRLLKHLWLQIGHIRSEWLQATDAVSPSPALSLPMPSCSERSYVCWVLSAARLLQRLTLFLSPLYTAFPPIVLRDENLAEDELLGPSPPVATGPTSPLQPSCQNAERFPGNGALG